MAVADYRAKFKKWPVYVATDDEMECWDVRPCEACGNPIFGDDYRNDDEFYYHPACVEPKTVEGRVA